MNWLPVRVNWALVAANWLPVASLVFWAMGFKSYSAQRGVCRIDEDEMTNIKVSTELAKRLEKTANASGLAIDLLLRKLIADATV